MPPISQFDTDPKGNLQVRALLEVYDVAPNFSQVREPPGEYGCMQKMNPTTGLLDDDVGERSRRGFRFGRRRLDDATHVKFHTIKSAEANRQLSKVVFLYVSMPVLGEGSVIVR